VVGRLTAQEGSLGTDLHENRGVRGDTR
jgi:hypothetical protein